MARKDEPLHEIKCSSCPTLNILNLYKKGRGKERYGGELTVLKASIKDEEAFPVYCCSGSLMCLTCQMMRRENIDEDDWSGYFLDIFWQFHTDIRTSFFLAFCGHYKASNQIMRSAYENLITGCYLSSLEPYQEEDRVKDYKKHLKGKLHFNMKKIEYVERTLQKLEMYPWKNQRELRRTYNTLSKYTHPTAGRYSFDCKKDNCIYSVQLDTEKLREWNEYFQKAILLFIIVYVNTFLGIEGLSENEGAVRILRSLLIEGRGDCDFPCHMSEDLEVVLVELNSLL